MARGARWFTRVTLGALGAAALATAAAVAAPRVLGPRVEPLTPAVREAVRGAGMSAGPARGAVMVSVYGAYQCDHCRRLHREVEGELLRLAREGRIRLSYVHAPLWAYRRGPEAAAAAYCAEEQGAGWEMHGRLFRAPAEWSSGDPPQPRFAAYAAELGLDSAALGTCLRLGDAAPMVARDLRSADRLGVDRLPMVVVNGSLVTPRRSPRELLTHVEREILRGR